MIFNFVSVKLSELSNRLHNSKKKLTLMEDAFILCNMLRFRLHRTWPRKVVQQCCSLNNKSVILRKTWSLPFIGNTLHVRSDFVVHAHQLFTTSFFLLCAGDHCCQDKEDFVTLALWFINFLFYASLGFVGVFTHTI